MRTKVVHITDDVCAMAQVVGQWPITLEVHIQSQELVVDQVTETGSSLNTVVLPVSIIPPMLHTYISLTYHQCYTVLVTVNTEK